MKRYITKESINNQVKEVVEEEYYSLIRIADILQKNKVESLTIETPQGDFHFRSNTITQEKNDNTDN